MSPHPPVKRNQPESFRARRFSVSLTVKDLQKSIVWYRDVVGFTVGEEFKRDDKVVGVRLLAGSVRIVINQDDGAKGHDRVKGQGMSMMYTTDQNVDEIANRIKANGGVLLMEPADMPWGPRMFRVEDPDGFKIAISSDT